MAKNRGNKKQHNSRRPFLSVVLVVFSLILFASNTSVYGANVKYVILMIADGWGPKQIEATNDYTGSAPLYQTDQVNWNSYYMSTYPFGGSYDPALAWADFDYMLENEITDSAAAASALYSGTKTAPLKISVTEDGSSRLFSIGEEAKLLNMAVGAVTTVYASHATPGAWVAHNDFRLNGYAIADEGFFGAPNTTSDPHNPDYTFNSECVDNVPLPDGDQLDDSTGIHCNYFGHHYATNPPVDVLIGAFGAGYTNDDIRNKLFEDSVLMENQVFVESITGVNAADTLTSAVSDPSVVKLAGLFDQYYHLADNSGYNSESPTLSESTSAALTVLSRNANGFMLMIEGGAVDWGGHHNVMDEMVGELIDYNSAVQTVTDWVDDPSNDSDWNNTLLVVTGDHECGYLTAGPDILPNQALGIVNAATIANEKSISGSGGRRASWEDNNPQNDEIDDGETIYWAWNTGGHSNSLIPLYTRGTGSGLFDGCIVGNDPVRGDYFDNTDVSKVILSAVAGITETGTLSVIPGQTLSGPTIDLTSIASSTNATNVMYIVRDGNDYCDVDMNGTYIEAENFSGTISQGSATYSVENSRVGHLGSGYLKSNGPGNLNCPPTEEGKEYDINFTDAGIYNVWIRAYAEDLSADSIFIGLDGSCVGSLSHGLVHNQWVWSNSIKNGVNTVNVATAGHHTINIWIREANELVDGIYITKGTETPSDAAHGTEIDPSDCSKFYSGDEVEAQSVDTTGWTEGIKELEIIGDDITCETPLAAVIDTFTFGVDVTAPLVDSTIPVNGAGAVTVNSSVTINWNEAVDCATVNATNITSDSPGWTLDTCSGSQAVFTTTGQAEKTLYAVLVTTAVTDVAGNPMAADYPFSYTTADDTAPLIDSTIPVNGTGAVPLNSSVTINWNENIDCATVNETNITSDSPGWALNTCSGSQAVFTTNSQAEGALYTVSVTIAVTDVAGNPMAASYPFSFTTVDETAPLVDSTIPVNGAGDVMVNSNVTINWNEAVDCATVNATNITSDSPGWTLNTCSGSQAVFETSGQLFSTSYNVNISTLVTDVAGNPLSSNYAFSYTTEPPPVIDWTACRTENGTANIQAGNSSNNVSLTIPITDLSKAFLLMDASGPQAVEQGQDHMVSGHILDLNALSFNRVGTGGQVEISYSLIECPNDEFTVQNGEIQLSNGTEFNTAVISAIDPARSLVIVNSRANISSTEQYQTLVTGEILDATTVKVQRASAAASADVYVHYQVVVFSAASNVNVQTGEVVFNGGQTATDTLGASVDMASTWLYFSNDASNDGPQQTAVSGQLSASSTVTFARHASNSYNNRIRYYAVEFPTGDVVVQRGASTYIGGGVSTVDHDIGISAVSSIDRAFTYVTNTTADTGVAAVSPLSAGNDSAGWPYGGTNRTQADRVYIDYTIPADTVGVIDTFELYVYSGSGDIQIFSASWNGSSITPRDIATVTIQGTSQTNTWTGLNLAVQSGDVLGFYGTSLRVRRDGSSTGNYAYSSLSPGVPLPGGPVSAEGTSTRRISVYATGPGAPAYNAYPRNRWTEDLLSTTSIRLSNWRGDTVDANTDFEWQVIEFQPLVDYYCDNDLDGYVSLSVSGTCSGTGCEPAQCQIIAGTDCDDRPDGEDGIPGTSDDGANINSGAAEVCDNLDNNCDGSTDENLTQPTVCGVGECGAAGEETCIAGTWGGDTCTPGTPTAEVCDNLDNNCDGSIDENVTQPTICGVGECGAAGEETCTAGTWGGDTCTPGTPIAEVCDNLDNNCDGSIDENLTQPTVCGVGECGAAGEETCTAGVWGGDTCTPGTPTAEVCDNLDNNCDGSIDENVTQPTACGVGECGAIGEETCTAGVWGGDTCTPGTPTAEVCDNLDNNCDGSINENVTQPTICGVGECGAIGEETCTAGVWGGDTCTPGTPTVEVCDNLDNNCDGSIDENVTQPTICGVGECGAIGEETCTAGVWGADTCTPGTPTVEVCDNLDNNCDGIIDENITQPTICGVGECGAIGEETCTAGVWGADTCTPGTPTAEVCDNLDNNCDGSVDENVTQATACGVGECGAIGEETCTAGVWGGDTCTPGTPTAEVCDNLDNNCDGSLDEGCDDDGDGFCDASMSVSGAPVPVCSASIDGPGDDCDDSEPNIYPDGPPVRIEGVPPSYKLLLQEAYDASVDNDVINSRGMELTENILINQAISVKLEAGYDCSYTSNTGKTTINGNVTISQGLLTIESGTVEIK